MRTKPRAFAVTPSVTWVDGIGTATPADWSDGGLGAFLNRIAARVDKEAVILMNVAAARALGLPATPDELPAGPELAESARAVGWKVTELGPWTNFFGKEKPALRLGIMSLMDREQFGLGAQKLADVTEMLAEWHKRTGHAYNAGPGASGLSILSACYPRAGRGIKPAWKPLRSTGTGDNVRQVAPGPLDAEEDDYHAGRPGDWHAPRVSLQWAHGYDFNRFYIGACMSAKVAAYELKRTGRRCEWSPDRAGWWEIEVPPWNLRHLPHPAGYDPSGKDRTIRPVTGATMSLLHELQEQGVIGEVRILDSWTAPGKEILKPWAVKMRDAWDSCPRPRCAEIKQAGGSDDDLCQVCQVVKTAGRATLGLMAKRSNWLYRPDWWFTVVAQARVNLWRKAWRIGGGLNGSGPWPLWIDVDNIWYGSDIADPRVACPDGIKLGPGLGQAKPKRSKRNKNWGR